MGSIPTVASISLFHQAPHWSRLRLAGAKRVAAAALLLVVSIIGQARAQGTPDPVRWTDAQKEHFLRTAEIVSQTPLEMGVTDSSRATLSDGVVRHDAHIQSIDIYRRRAKIDGRTVVDFWDTYRYNIAAYKLDRLLDLGMVPVSVERTVGGSPAAVTWWVDDVAMTATERSDRQLMPPDVGLWADQRSQGRIFNQLIENSDPNQGNHLITRDWKLWLVDFTRAFRTHKRLDSEKTLGRIDRRFLNALERLSEESLEQATDAYLNGRERKAILVRRDQLLGLFRRRIDSSGEAAVVCDRPGH